jgi:hypothetical protein
MEIPSRRCYSLFDCQEAGHLPGSQKMCAGCIGNFNSLARGNEYLPTARTKSNIINKIFAMDSECCQYINHSKIATFLRDRKHKRQQSNDKKGVAIYDELLANCSNIDIMLLDCALVSAEIIDYLSHQDLYIIAQHYGICDVETSINDLKLMVARGQLITFREISHAGIAWHILEERSGMPAVEIYNKMVCGMNELKKRLTTL